MPASEFQEWMEFSRIEPFGSLRDNWHMAVLATILANAYRDPKRPPVEMKRFFYTDDETAQEEKDKELFKFFGRLKPNGD